MTTRAESSSSNRPPQRSIAARTEFFERIRTEMGKTRGLFPASLAARPPRPAEAIEIVQRQIAERWRETAQRFQREFERVGGVFHRVATIADVPAAIAGIARERAASRVVAWNRAALGHDLTPDLVARGLAVDAADVTDPADAERSRLRGVSAVADLGVTGTDVAIAETGTLVLRSGGGRPRATSLLPPTHVAVFDATALIESIAQLGLFLEAWHVGEPAPGDDRLGGMITLITGPSRTADIELTLTRGVHGPKEVHAVFVEAPFHG